MSKIFYFFYFGIGSIFSTVSFIGNYSDNPDKLLNAIIRYREGDNKFHTTNIGCALIDGIIWPSYFLGMKPYSVSYKIERLFK